MLLPLLPPLRTRLASLPGLPLLRPSCKLVSLLALLCLHLAVLPLRPALPPVLLLRLQAGPLLRLPWQELLLPPLLPALRPPPPLLLLLAFLQVSPQQMLLLLLLVLP